MQAACQKCQKTPLQLYRADRHNVGVAAHRNRQTRVSRCPLRRPNVTKAAGHFQALSDRPTTWPHADARAFVPLSEFNGWGKPSTRAGRLPKGMGKGAVLCSKEIER